MADMTPPRPPPAPIPPLPERRRLIDFSLPITWLVAMFISGVGGLLWIGWMAADQKNLLKQVVESQAESKMRLGEISARTDSLRDQYMELRQSQAIIVLRVNNLEKEKK